MCVDTTGVGGKGACVLVRRLWFGRFLTLRFDFAALFRILYGDIVELP